jgi:ribosomal protein L37AE/L43A
MKCVLLLRNRKNESTLCEFNSLEEGRQNLPNSNWVPYVFYEGWNLQAVLNELKDKNPGNDILVIDKNSYMNNFSIKIRFVKKIGTTKNEKRHYCPNCGKHVPDSEWQEDARVCNECFDKYPGTNWIEEHSKYYD